MGGVLCEVKPYRFLSGKVIALRKAKKETQDDSGGNSRSGRG